VEISFFLFGQILIYSFSLILAIGALIGLQGVVNAAVIEGNDTRIYLKNANYILLGSLIGGRAAYAGINWAFFKNHLAEIPQIWLGGLSWPGALGGGLLTIALIALLQGWHFGALCDANLPLLTAMTISIWLGCWVAGTAYGPKVDIWWGVPAVDIGGQMALRWPLQLLGAMLTTLLSWITTMLWGKIRAPGLRFSFTLAGISLIQLMLIGLRVDPGPHWYDRRLEFWAALGFFIFSATIAMAIYIKTYTHSSNLEKL